MLFVSKWNPASILIRLWEKCVTNCYNCCSIKDKQKFYKYEQFEKILNFMKERCDKSFSIFLFWTDVINHPDIDKFLSDPIIKLFRRHPVHISPLYEKNRVEKIMYLYKKFPDTKFDTCYYIKNMGQLKLFFKMVLFLKKNNVPSSMDIFLDLSYYGKLIKEFFIRNWFEFRLQIETSHLNFDKCLEFTANNKNLAFMIYHTKPQIILEDRIEHIPNNGCVARKTFKIKWNQIFVYEEIEIDGMWNIKMHINSYCSKAIKRISDVKKADEEIIEDFKKLDEYLKQFDTDDMWKSCFKCISQPFINK